MLKMGLPTPSHDGKLHLYHHGLTTHSDMVRLTRKEFPGYGQHSYRDLLNQPVSREPTYRLPSLSSFGSLED